MSLDILKKANLAETAVFLEENLKMLFSSPIISDYYEIVKDKDVTTEGRYKAKLVMAWLAFLCGDNVKLAQLYKSFRVELIYEKEELSLFYSLEAFVSEKLTLVQRASLAKKAYDLIEDGGNGVLKANAMLTHAQILASSDQYREAANLFYNAYLNFELENMEFPAAVSYVNMLLNKYKVGEYQEIIEFSQRLLQMNGVFKKRELQSWNLLHLPLGMCYFELNKPSLAINHLLKAKECIDEMNLFRMHGFIEIYLFKAFFVLDDSERKVSIRNKLIQDFNSMNYHTTDVLICIFEIMTHEGERKEKKAEIEKLEIEFQKRGLASEWILIEVMLYMKAMGLSDIFRIKDIEEYIIYMRKTGHVTSLNLVLVLYTNIMLNENRKGAAREALREALSLHRKYGMIVSFSFLSEKGYSILRGLDEVLFNKIAGEMNRPKILKEKSVLTGREKEIMELVSAGMSNDEIGRTLFLTIGTVKWHMNRIFLKLEVSNRVQAAQKSNELGEI